MFSVTWLKHLGVQDWCGSVTQRAAGSQSWEHLPGAGQTRPTPAERSFGEIQAWGQTCTSYGRTSLNYHLPPRGCAGNPVPWKTENWTWAPCRKICGGGRVLCQPQGWATLMIESYRLTSQARSQGGILLTGGWGFISSILHRAQESFWHYWGPGVCKES